MTSLPLTPFADVYYNLPAVGSTRRGFNLGLVIGESPVISTSDRVKKYSSLAEMVTDGFSTSSDEYLAAQRYFAASSRPSEIAIGRQGSGETCLAAVQACRAADDEWYICYVPGATDPDHEAIAAYIEALDAPYSQYFLQTEDADVLNDVSSNLFETLKDAGYKRTHGLYSTDDHAIAGVMGYAMGQTSDLANSAYTLKFKTFPGVTVDDLTTQQVSNIEGNNGNVYITRGNDYDMYEQGIQFSGDFFDEIIYLDKLVNNIQIAVANQLYQTPKIPQTEDGMAQLRAVASAPCQTAVGIGFLAPGKWTGERVLTLNTGDYLPSGYLVMSESIASQSQADREDRKAPPIYVAAKLAGAIHSVVIEINVNR